jgi:hypothetical protein
MGDDWFYTRQPGLGKLVPLSSAEPTFGYLCPKQKFVSVRVGNIHCAVEQVHSSI